MKLYGLLITKEDQAILADWCRSQLDLYDAVVCLDGSDSPATRQIVKQFSRRLIYLHERDWPEAARTDHGLRGVVHREIVRRYGVDNWIMCCHADEFCYHDPRKVAVLADRSGYDGVSWFSPLFYPHPSEFAAWAERPQVLQAFRHYYWSYHGDGFPWCEDRLYRNGPQVGWDATTHGSVRPHHVESWAPFHPILRHYKVITTDLGWYEKTDRCTFFRQHWQGQSHRTGLPFPVRRLADLFVKSVPEFTRCNRFDGTFPQPWNMGDEYCPDPSGTPNVETSKVKEPTS